MMCSFISKFAIISPKKLIVKIRKIEAGPDSNGGENHTLCSSFWSLNLKKNYVETICICTSANTRRFSPAAVELIKHRQVPVWASSGARAGICRFD